MQINLTGHHVDITPALRDYVHSKMDRIIRHFDQLVGIQVVLSVEKLRQKAEAKLLVANNEIYAEATEEDMYAAIDKLTDKVDRQVRKHKEKITDHHRRDRDKVREAG